MTAETESRREYGDSRLPACEQLVPRLKDSGRDWLIELARWYESGWQVALDGAPKPTADSVLRLITDDRQEEVRQVFESIDSRYASMVSAAPGNYPDPTVAMPAGPAVATPDHSEQADTATLSNDTATQTGNTDPSAADDKGANSDGMEVTIDSPNPAELDLTRTIASDKASVDFEDDQTVNKPAVRLGHGSHRGAAAKIGLPEIPGYQIKKVLGRGGMGIVYLAHQEGIDRPVALKMILARGHIDHVALDRFYAEARAIGRFQHENIVRIYDAGTHDGMPYFSLEFVEGASLADQLKGEPMDPREAARLLEPMARAMQKAHDAGVIHRDLKPGNVLMTQDGVPKITDFGLAKELEKDQQLSQDGTVLGTPAFMSPEQATGSRDVGPLSDVYGLGAVLYCLLTGRPPFQGAKTTDTLMQVINDEPIIPTRLQPGIPKDLETICLKCLQKDLTQRYSDATALADDLGRFLRDEPILARPVSRSERVWRWCKRNPVIAGASSVATVLALVVMIGGPVSAAVIYGQKQEVTEAKEEAEDNAQLAVRRAEEANEARVLADSNRLLAEENADVATEQEKIALDALRAMTFKVQREMSGQTNLVDLRKELIGTVQNRLQGLRDNENTSRKKDMMAARIQALLGDINLEIGSFQEARERYNKCLAVLEAVRDTEEGVPLPDQNFSRIYDSLGDSSRMLGDLSTAESQYEESLRIRRRRSEKFPAIKTLEAVKSYKSFAVSLGKVGSLSQAIGDLPRAREAMEEALAVRERVFKVQHNAENLNELLGARSVLAKVVFQQGETDDAIKLITETADRMRKHAAENPQSDPARHNSAMFDTEMAVMQLYVGQTDQAETNFQRSVDRFESLFDKDPNNGWLQEELEDATYGLLVARREAGKQDSNEIIERLLQLRQSAVEQDPENTGKQIRRLVALARCGKLTEGSELAEKLREQIDPSDALNYDLACAYALLAAAREAAGQDAGEDLSQVPSAQALRQSSIASLRGLLAAGFYRPTDLKLDPDLDAVRDSEAFQQLIQQSAPINKAAE